MSHLTDAQAEEAKVLYWDGVWGYMDLAFLNELHSVQQLNHYEKLLLGVMRARVTFILKGKQLNETSEIH